MLLICQVFVVLVFCRRERVCGAFVYSCGSVWSVTDLINATVSGQNSSLPAKECCVLPGLCIGTVCSLLLPAFPSLSVSSKLAFPSHPSTPLYTHMHFFHEERQGNCEISLSSPFRQVQASSSIIKLIADIVPSLAYP